MAFIIVPFTELQCCDQTTENKMHVDEKYCALRLVPGERQWKKKRGKGEILQHEVRFYQLSTRARFSLEKLILIRPVKKFLALYETRKFITVFKIPSHLFLS
jgi:hypothetical protein